MKKFSFIQTIEQAIQDCLSFGNGKGNFGNGNIVCAEWVKWDERQDIIEIHFMENGVIKHSEFIMETLTDS